MTRIIAVSLLQIALLTAAGCSLEDSGTNQAAAERTRDVVAERTAPRPTTPATGRDGSGHLPVEPVSMTTEIASPDDVAVLSDVDHLAVGRTAFSNGEMQAAADALSLSRDDPRTRPYDRYLLGLALFKTGRLEAAEEVLSDVSWRMETFARATVNLARVRIERGDLAGAEKALERALASDPDFTDAHNVLGRVRLARGDVDGAAEAFRRAAELDSTNPWPLNNLGYALLVSGRELDAIAPLEEAVSRRDDLAVAWQNLALAREHAGDLAGAALASASAEELDPDNDEFAATAARLAALAPEELSPPVKDASTTTAAVASATPEAAGADLSSLP